MHLNNILLIMRGGVTIKTIKNTKVIGLAKRVKKQSDKYKNQLQVSKKLNKKKYIFFSEVAYLIQYQLHLSFLYFLLKRDTW